MNRWSRLALTVSTAALSLLAGCSFTGSDKVPISTSSSKALEYYKEGRSLAERLRQQEAYEKFEQAVAEDPQFALGYLALAQSSPSPKGFFANLDRAKSLIDRVSEGERLLIEAVEAAANGDPTSQGQYLNKLLALYPNDERVYDQIGNYYFGQQKYDSAIAVYTQANQLNPGFSPPYNMLGYCYRFLGNYQAAEKSFRKYMELIPDDPNPYDSYAELLTKMGRYEDAIENYRKALKVKNDFAPSYIGIATNLDFLGRYDEARHELREFYAKAHDDGQQRGALFAIAVSYTDQGLLDSALVILEDMRKIAAAVDDAAAQAVDYDNMGQVLLHAEKPDAAAEKFKQSLDALLNSSLFPSVKENARLDNIQRRSLVALVRGNLAVADSLAGEYLRLSTETDNPFRVRAAHLALGLVALKKKNYDQAILELKQSDQTQAFNIFYLAVAYEGAGRIEEAQSYYRQAADFNQLNSLGYAFIRRQALAKVNQQTEQS